MSTASSSGCRTTAAPRLVLVSPPPCWPSCQDRGDAAATLHARSWCLRSAQALLQWFHRPSTLTPRRSSLPPPDFAATPSPDDAKLKAELERLGRSQDLRWAKENQQNQSAVLSRFSPVPKLQEAKPPPPGWCGGSAASQAATQQQPVPPPQQQLQPPPQQQPGSSQAGYEPHGAASGPATARYTWPTRQPPAHPANESGAGSSGQAAPQMPPASSSSSASMVEFAQLQLEMMQSGGRLASEAKQRRFDELRSAPALRPRWRPPPPPPCIPLHPFCILSASSLHALCTPPLPLHHAPPRSAQPLAA
jgi:hypothetical protein